MDSGIKDIDKQHQIIITIFNDLTDITDGKKPLKTLNLILESMTRYGQYHIETEETFMKSIGFVDEEHLYEHERFIEKTIEFENQDMSMELAEAAHDFLYGWLTQHITCIDKRYMDFYKNLPA